MSLLIFAFGVLGLLGLEARAISSATDAENRNRAAMFANEVSSNMWLAGTVTVSAAQLAAWNVNVANNTAQGLPNGVLAIAPVAGTTNSTDITITWRAPTRANTASDGTSSLTTRVILP